MLSCCKFARAANVEPLSLWNYVQEELGVFSPLVLSLEALSGGAFAVREASHTVA